MVAFIAIIWFKPDRKSNGRSISVLAYKWPFKKGLVFLVFKWLHQDGGEKWSGI
jgi:hypothetical protein